MSRRTRCFDDFDSVPGGFRQLVSVPIDRGSVFSEGHEDQGALLHQQILNRTVEVVCIGHELELFIADFQD